MPDKKNIFSSDFKLGILGGGQLGKMLLHETQRYDIRTKVMDANPEAPARIGCDEFVQGELTDENAVLNFGEDCDVITIEIENVNVAALEKLEEKGKTVYPKPKTLKIIQNKIRQKKFYRDHKIPTATFFSFVSEREMTLKLKKCGFDAPFVWKAAEGGYDGRGVQMVETPEDLEIIPDMPGLIEEMIPFEKEISIIVARNPSGEMKSFPVVEMEFHPTANLVEYVFCPADIEEKVQNEAVKLAERVAEDLNHVGILAVEMFLTLEGVLLVNECAPRVHNSGHLTIEGNAVSQFEQHLRAILDLPLGNPKTLHPAVMINLIGEENHSGSVVYEGMEEVLKTPRAYVHLYGKKETRPFRKMGHVTVTHEFMSDARINARHLKDKILVKSIEK